MALNKISIFLTFTTVVLAISSICLRKCYLSEKKEKLRQIDQNVQLNIEKNEALAAIEELQAQIVQDNNLPRDVLESNRILRNRCQAFERENHQLAEANESLGDNLRRLQEINHQIEGLQVQLRAQLNRNIHEEVLAENIDRDDRRIAREQNLEYDRMLVTAGLNTQIKDLHDEFLRMRLPQIRLEVQVEAYRRHNQIVQAYLNELISDEGRINGMNMIDVSRLRMMVAENNDDMEAALQEFNERIDRELVNRQIVG